MKATGSEQILVTEKYEGGAIHLKTWGLREKLHPKRELANSLFVSSIILSFLCCNVQYMKSETIKYFYGCDICIAKVL